MEALPKRDWTGIVQWIVTLDTDRLGDWVIVETSTSATQQDVARLLTRTQRRKATSFKRTLITTPTEELTA